MITGTAVYFTPAGIRLLADDNNITREQAMTATATTGAAVWTPTSEGPRTPEIITPSDATQAARNEAATYILNLELAANRRRRRIAVARKLNEMPHEPHIGHYIDPDRPTVLEAICTICRELGFTEGDGKTIKHAHQLHVIGLTPQHRSRLATYDSWAMAASRLWNMT